MLIRGGSILKALATATIFACSIGAAAGGASAAGVQTRDFVVKTPHVDGPVEYDKAFVQAYGNPRAKNVLAMYRTLFLAMGGLQSLMGRSTCTTLLLILECMLRRLLLINC